MWNVIYVHFYNWDIPLNLVPVMYDLIKLIIETSLWTNNYSTFDTHTQHIRLLFNKCLFHLCDCTCSNVMYILSCLSIKSKNIFEYFICFWSVFMLSCFEFCSNCIFHDFHQKLLQRHFHKKLTTKLFLQKWVKAKYEITKFRQKLSLLSRYYFPSKVFPEKVLCFRGIFHE